MPKTNCWLIRTIVLSEEPELCGGFCTWLTTGQRTWMNGRYLAATWDVEKLESMKEEIVQGDRGVFKILFSGSL